MATKKADVQALVTQTYVGLMNVPWDAYKMRTACLARFGHYEVRLIEGLITGDGLMPNLWIELYAVDLRSSIDSYGCDDLDAAVLAAEHLLEQAQQLAEEPHDERPYSRRCYVH